MTREECGTRDVFVTQHNMNLDSLADEVKKLGSFYFNIELDHLVPITDSRVELKDSIELNVQGRYIEKTGKILLREDLWCKKTIIHEVMHSTSKLSNENFGRVDKALCEGLTELLSGFLLWYYSFTCYEKWRKHNTYCKVKYEPYTRFWYTFFRFVPISTGLKFYFGFHNRGWKRRFDDLIKQVPKISKKRFKNPRKMIGPLYRNFKKECERYFSPTFEYIYKNESSNLDFSKIKNNLRTEALIDNLFK